MIKNDQKIIKMQTFSSEHLKASKYQQIQPQFFTYLQNSINNPNIFSFLIKLIKKHLNLYCVKMLTALNI